MGPSIGCGVCSLHPIDGPIASPSALEDRAVAMILEAKYPLAMIGAASNRPRLVELLSDSYAAANSLL